MSIEEFLAIIVFMLFPFAGASIVFSAVGAAKELITGFKQGFVDWFVIEEFGFRISDEKVKVGSFRFILGVSRSALIIFSLFAVAATMVFLGPLVYLAHFPYLKPAQSSVFIVYIIILLIYTFALGNVIHSRTSDEKARITKNGIDFGKFYSGPFRKYSFVGSSLFPRRQLMIEWKEIEEVHIDRRILLIPKIVVKTKGTYMIKHISENSMSIAEKALVKFGGGKVLGQAILPCL